MKYRVTYKRLSEVAVSPGHPGAPMSMIIVDDCIEADDFDVKNDGTVVFYDDDGTSVMAIPATFFTLIEPWDRSFDNPPDKKNALIVP